MNNKTTQDFIQLLEYHFEKFLKQNDLLEIWRLKAWELFIKLGLSKENNPFSNLYLKEYTLSSNIKLSKKKIEKFIDSNCSSSHIVFVNGYYDEELTNISDIKDQIELLDFEKAMHKEALFLQKVMMRSLKVETNSFAALNAALQKKGLYIHVKKDVKIKKPIQIIHVITSKEETIITPRILIYAEKNSTLNIINTLKCLEKNSNIWINQVIDFCMENQSSCQFFEDIFDINNNWYFNTKRAHLSQNSSLKIINVSHELKNLVEDYYIDLAEEEASIDIKNLKVLKKTDEHKIKLKIEHNSKKTKSNLLFKTVADDTSKFSFLGEVILKFNAKKSISSLVNRNLLVGKKATISSKPEMRIFVDDVKATHGMVVTKLSDEDLFYLQSRGLDDQISKEFLIDSFCKEITDSIVSPFNGGVKKRWLSWE